MSNVHTINWDGAVLTPEELLFVESGGILADSGPDEFLQIVGHQLVNTTITPSGGTPGGSDTQVQFNMAGVFGGISLVTSDGTKMTFGTNGLYAENIRANSSTGLLIESNNGTDVGLLGAGNAANITWYGYHYYDSAVTNTIAGFVGASKTLLSLDTAIYPNLTELAYVKGVTSAIQTQLNAKQATISLGAIGSTPNANGMTLTGATLNLEPASSSFGGIVTTSTQTFAGAKTFSSTLTVSGANSITGTGSFSSASSSMQLLGSSTVYYTTAVTNGVASTLATGISYGRYIMGAGSLTTFTSGTHALIAGAAYKPLTITNAGATVTNTATVYIENAMSGGTNNYALWIDDGILRADGNLQLNGGLITDNSGNEVIGMTFIGGAVNYFSLANSATGDAPQFAVAGDDTDIDFVIRAKGSGTFQFWGTSAKSAEIRLYEDTDNGVNYIGLASPTSVGSSYTYILPDTDGSNGDMLVTNGSGVMSWATPSGGSGTNLFTADQTQTANRTHNQDSYTQYFTNANTWTLESITGTIVLDPGTSSVSMTDGSNGFAFATSSAISTSWMEWNRTGENPIRWYTGTGSPEGVVTSDPGSQYVDESNGDLYKKASGISDTGWITVVGGGSGDVSKVGTPADNQMAVWTGDGTLEGTSDFTYNGTSLNLVTGKNFQIAGSTILADASGTTTLSNIDAIDSTTELTIEAAIDTLANLTSIQGKTVTLGGNFITSGASSLTLTTTGATNVTLPTTGTLSTLAGVESLSNKTLSGATVLAESASIQLDPALSADGTFTGISRTGTAGTTLAFGDLIYLDPTDSRWELADANAAQGADGDARGILGMCVQAAADGSATTILLYGTIRADTAFPAMTINNQMYVSETAGDITGTQPATTDAVIRVVGYATTADELFFCPSPDYITHV